MLSEQIDIIILVDTGGINVIDFFLEVSLSGKWFYKKYMFKVGHLSI